MSHWVARAEDLSKRKSRARLGKIGHSGWAVRSQRGLSAPGSMGEGPGRQRGPRGPPSSGTGHGVGKAAGTGARELSTRGQGAQRDEGRSRAGVVRMVRRSQRRKLQKFTGLCGQEGLRVREGGRGQGKGRAGRWQQEMGEGLFGEFGPRNKADREG